jgi:hypothetical protein
MSGLIHKNVKIDAELDVLLRAFAQSRGISEPAVIREALRAYLASSTAGPAGIEARAFTEAFARARQIVVQEVMTALREAEARYVMIEEEVYPGVAQNARGPRTG